MIEIQSLTRQFGDFKAVDNLSFSVSPGEVLGFLGPNGAGKSTTMKMLTGFLTPSAGRIRICGHDIESDPLAAKQLIGYLPEGAPCYGDMTVQAFLDFIADMRGLSGSKKTERINTVVAQVQLQEVLAQSIETLSKGFKRRVGLAQAILHDPKVLILDEPTDGLDPNQKHQVRELIRGMAKDKILIISTHILEEVTAVCSRAIIIARGRLLADGKPQDLLARSKYHGAARVVLNRDHQAEERDALAALPGVKAVEVIDAHELLVLPQHGQSTFAVVSELLRQQQWPVQQLFAESGRLDDVFRDVTAGV
ncbi:ATP-binding cassette domain-containing protein [Permianibacter sp. IMCC34836]|uniref:ABC transporter ATP-binding protein n=1 Tax=Permianibacter fluminis TaxID=2738515 RepID=UPI0015557E6E|nr:ATP-binding cassette domain-containing protein [Permianibacter fluminis]NQD36986.1 ATP-binding cassette domain-containing protein [Permianibacter fluminis]